VRVRLDLALRPGQGELTVQYLYVNCDCGAHLVNRMAPEFEETIPLPFPSKPDGNRDARSVAAADFIAWESAGDALALPTLYRVWLHRADAPGRTGRAVYFRAGGDDYSVFASLTPTLTARKLPAGWLHEKLLPAQKQATGYAQAVIPRLEDLPGRSLQPADEDANIPISPDGFEELFAGSEVELEALPFVEVFGRALGELAGAAQHARSCGRDLRLRHL
jgi:hypothetical protein